MHTEPASYPVALVSMPFVAIEFPSIQIGLLKAIASAAGFPVTNYHLSLDFARQIGRSRYAVLASHRGLQVGEWLFAAAAFDADRRAQSDYFLRDFRDEIEGRLAALADDPLRCLESIRRHEVPKFLNAVMDTIPWGTYRVVGFTSTFQQNVASFALAERIKRRFPDIVTVFGGANFEGEMGIELVRNVRCIDFAVSGEADAAFPDLLRALANGDSPASIEGVLSRSRTGVQGQQREPFRGLDRLPTPDYEDYFERGTRLGMIDSESRQLITLPFESSRGCWWGQKHHCTFCGLNGAGMAFRTKSPERVHLELAALASRHKVFRFAAVDNILSMAYLQDFLPRLRDEGINYSLFYETKANLRREHIALLAAAGVTCIQPGIESLSSNVLRLMGKGVTALQNVNLLRWAGHYGIRVVWNVLWGFPGETLGDYRGQAELIPRLIHLQPPLSATRIWMERFSPVFQDRSRFPVRRLEAEASYAYVYPRTIELDRVAYFFDYEFAEALPEAAYEDIGRATLEWQRAWEMPTKPALTFRKSPDLTVVTDRRDSAHESKYAMHGPLGQLYAACSDTPHTAAAVKDSSHIEWDVGRISEALEGLCELGLMISENESFLSLAIPELPCERLQTR